MLVTVTTAFFTTLFIIVVVGALIVKSANDEKEKEEGEVVVVVVVVGDLTSRACSRLWSRLAVCCYSTCRGRVIFRGGGRRALLISVPGDRSACIECEY